MKDTAQTRHAQRRKEAGLCRSCITPVMLGSDVCEKHYEIRKKHNAAYQIIQKEKGLCSKCSKSAVLHHRYCLEHQRLRRTTHLKDRYGLTEAAYLALARAQRWRCAICQKRHGRRRHRRKSGSSGLVVDHNHKTSKVRALLCDPCNRGIAFFHEDIDRLLSAIAFIKKHSL